MVSPSPSKTMSLVPQDAEDTEETEDTEDIEKPNIICSLYRNLLCYKVESHTRPETGIFLDILKSTDKFLVSQEVGPVEIAITAFETNNKYRIFNSSGDQIFFAAEQTDWMTRNTLGSSRSFTMHIYNMSGRAVMQLFRRGALGICSRDGMRVQVVPNLYVGHVTQMSGCCCDQTMAVYNFKSEPIYVIDVPACGGSTVEFKIKDYRTRIPVGKICRYWPGILKQAFTCADNFGISFPENADVHIKAVLLGALFLIDYMFYEKSSRGYILDTNLGMSSGVRGNTHVRHNNDVFGRSWRI